MTNPRLPALPSVPFCRARHVAGEGVLPMLGKAPDDPLFTADQMRAYAAAAVAEALEEAAKRCEALQDPEREAYAATRAKDEELAGLDVREKLERLRHLSDVRLYNAGPKKCAAAIRARGAQGEAR